MSRRSLLAKAYASFFVVATFLAEGVISQDPQGTPTTSAGLIIPTPQLNFLSSGQPSTCGAADITWFYTGAEGSFTFVATNVGVAQDIPAPAKTSTKQFSTDGESPTPSIAARALPTGADDPTLLTTLTIGTNIDPYKYNFLWDPVDVCTGWYIVKATMPSMGYSIDSPAFFVYNSTDLSCLPYTSSSTAPIPTATGSSTIVPSTSFSTSPSGTALPVGGASSSKINMGAIIGAVIGVVAVVAACLIAWLCFYRKAHRSTPAAGGRAPKARHWSGLTSVDSGGGLMGNGSQNNFSGRQLPIGSVGTIPPSPSEEAIAMGLEKKTMHSTFGDPFNGPQLALAALPVLQNQAPLSKSPGRISQTYSTSSSNGFASNEYTSHSGAASRPSVPDSTLGRQSTQSIESTTYPPSSLDSPQRNSAHINPTTSAARSHSLSTSATHQTSAFTHGGAAHSTTSHAGLLHQGSSPSTSPSSSPYHMSDPTSPISPASPSDNAKQGSRQFQGGKKRKPVPTYDPSSEFEPPSHPILASASPSPIPPSSPSPGPEHTYTPHYTTRSQAGHDHSQHELVHKSSFGPGGVEGKPLHYLIPDMPMPLKG